MIAISCELVKVCGHVAPCWGAVHQSVAGDGSLALVLVLMLNPFGGK